MTIYIENNYTYSGTSAGNYKYIVKDLVKESDKRKSPTTSMPRPGEPAEKNILLAFQGEEGEVTLNFWLYNDGTDRADGTAPQDGTYSDTDGDGTEDVVSIMEQRHFLEYYVKRAEIDATYTLYDTNDAIMYEDSRDVYLEEVNFIKENQEPLRLRAEARLKVGQGVQ